MDKLNCRPNCLASFVKFNSAIDCVIGILDIRNATYDFIKGKILIFSLSVRLNRTSINLILIINCGPRMVSSEVFNQTKLIHTNLIQRTFAKSKVLLCFWNCRSTSTSERIDRVKTTRKNSKEMVIDTLLKHFDLNLLFTISLNENKWHLQFLPVSDQLQFYS